MVRRHNQGRRSRYLNKVRRDWIFFGRELQRRRGSVVGRERKVSSRRGLTP